MSDADIMQNGTVIDLKENSYAEHSINIDELSLNINKHFQKNDISDTEKINSRHIENNLNSEIVHSDVNNDYYVLDAVSTNSGING